MPIAPLPAQWVTKGLKLFFKLFYHQLAWSYDTVAWLVSLGMWNDWVKSVLPSVQGPNILEVGHGPGHLLLALRTLDYHVVGLDESRQMGRLAVEGLARKGFDGLCVNGYAQLMPFPDDYFNSVCATFPSEYVLDTNTLSEILRVLVPGGRLIILPTAWFDETYKPGRLVASLFGLMGQSPEISDVYTKPLIDSGFQTNTEVRSLPKSKTLIILATKPKIS